MPQRRILSHNEARSIIKGKWWSPTSLVAGILEVALRPSTVEIKKSCIRSFLSFLATLGHPFAASKIPYRFVIDYFVDDLDNIVFSKRKTFFLFSD